MIIYGSAYDELRAFRVSARVDVEVLEKDGAIEGVLYNLLREFNGRLRDTETQLPDIPMEYMDHKITRSNTSNFTTEVIMAFRPYATAMEKPVMLLEEFGKVTFIPIRMERLEVRKLNFTIPSAFDTEPPRSSIPHHTDYYVPWGFDLATGNYVWKKVRP